MIGVSGRGDKVLNEFVTELIPDELKSLSAADLSNVCSLKLLNITDTCTRRNIR